MSESQLDTYAKEIDKALQEAKTLMSKGDVEPELVFDVRGRLYELALELAPNARQDDIDAMREWIQPKQGEVSIDIAAGTGFLTKHLVEWTQATVFAVDPSKVQLETLFRTIKSALIKPIVGSLAQETTGVADQIKTQVDFITSFGGIHHVHNQRKMMEHAEQILKSGGRFVAADVCDNTPLSKHFDDVVTRKCITSHTARWLSEDRLKELIEPLSSLLLTKFKMKTQHWVFNSKREMALFFKGLHAYDLSEDEVVHDLYDHLGFEEKEGKVVLNWPMMFFEIIKK